MSIESMAGRIAAELRAAMEMSDELEMTLSFDVVRGKNDATTRTAVARVGDYELWVFSWRDDGKVQWDYCPTKHDKDWKEWARDVDPATIKSFTEPPVKKDEKKEPPISLVESEQEESPATDQSTQG